MYIHDCAYSICMPCSVNNALLCTEPYHALMVDLCPYIYMFLAAVHLLTCGGGVPLEQAWGSSDLLGGLP